MQAYFHFKYSQVSESYLVLNQKQLSHVQKDTLFKFEGHKKGERALKKG